MKSILSKLLNLKYLAELKRSGLNIPKDRINSSAKLKFKKNNKEYENLSSVTGILGKELECHFSDLVNWKSIDTANFSKIDFIIFDDEAFELNSELIKDFVSKYGKQYPIVFFFKKIPNIGEYSCVLETASKIFLSGDINVEGTPLEKIEHLIVRTDYYIDIKKYLPVNRMNSTGRIGIIIDNYSLQLENFETLCNELEYWSLREELQIISYKGEGLSGISNKPFLVSSLSEVCENIEEANQTADASVLLNFTKHQFTNYEIYKRMSKGQLAVNVFQQPNNECSFDNLLDAKRENVFDFLHKAKGHFILDKLSVRCTRKVLDNYSPVKHIRNILNLLNSKSLKPRGISVVACTSKPSFLKNIIENYKRQSYKDKELVIVLHSDKISIKKVVEQINDSSIRVYHRNPNSLSFGYCLNFGILQSNKEYIAKFDDDDYYSEEYLSDMMNAYSYTDAKVIGKFTFHTYMHGSSKFVTRKPGGEYKYTSFLPGATFLIKRDVFYNNMFRDIPRDIDGKFCADCAANKIKMYSIDSFNLLVNRYEDKNIHTWKATDQLIIRQSLPAVEEIDELLVNKQAYIKVDSIKLIFDTAKESVRV
ncbi:glycosyltransferase family 2 protein [Paenibacillus lautus]|uniref:glycosyltransferase n=1 Tax=Paenibacillus lautus TaxID=1401 RepID=UPI002DB7D9B7|nr:glycosyltransferase family A protein [Paenibacillus lautus]MEC0258398.1 glycosyltransferase family A protein [Paenibacillus lautus]